MLPLREVGILGIAYVDTRSRTVEPAYWKPKSPTRFDHLIAAPPNPRPGKPGGSTIFRAWLTRGR